MNNLIAIGIIIIVLGNAIWYLIRKRKQGIKCIGCPSCGNCSNCNETHSCNQTFNQLP